MKFCKPMYTLNAVLHAAMFLQERGFIKSPEDFIEFLKIGTSHRNKAYKKQFLYYRKITKD